MKGDVEVLVLSNGCNESSAPKARIHSMVHGAQSTKPCMERLQHVALVLWDTRESHPTRLLGTSTKRRGVYYIKYIQHPPYLIYTILYSSHSDQSSRTTDPLSWLSTSQYPSTSHKWIITSPQWFVRRMALRETRTTSFSPCRISSMRYSGIAPD